MISTNLNPAKHNKCFKENSDLLFQAIQSLICETQKEIFEKQHFLSMSIEQNSQIQLLRNQKFEEQMNSQTNKSWVSKGDFSAIMLSLEHIEENPKTEYLFEKIKLVEALIKSKVQKVTELQISIALKTQLDYAFNARNKSKTKQPDFKSGRLVKPAQFSEGQLLDWVVEFLKMVNGRTDSLLEQFEKIKKSHTKIQQELQTVKRERMEQQLRQKWQQSQNEKERLKLETENKALQERIGLLERQLALITRQKQNSLKQMLELQRKQEQTQKELNRTDSYTQKLEKQSHQFVKDRSYLLKWFKNKLQKSFADLQVKTVIQPIAEDAAQQKQSEGQTNIFRVITREELQGVSQKIQELVNNYQLTLASKLLTQLQAITEQHEKENTQSEWYGNENSPPRTSSPTYENPGSAHLKSVCKELYQLRSANQQVLRRSNQEVGKKEFSQKEYARSFDMLFALLKKKIYNLLTTNKKMDTELKKAHQQIKILSQKCMHFKSQSVPKNSFQRDKQNVKEQSSQSKQTNLSSILAHNLPLQVLPLKAKNMNRTSPIQILFKQTGPLFEQSQKIAQKLHQDQNLSHKQLGRGENAECSLEGQFSRIQIESPMKREDILPQTTDEKVTQKTLKRLIQENASLKQLIRSLKRTIQQLKGVPQGQNVPGHDQGFKNIRKNFGIKFRTEQNAGKQQQSGQFSGKENSLNNGNYLHKEPKTQGMDSNLESDQTSTFKKSCQSSKCQEKLKHLNDIINYMLYRVKGHQPLHKNDTKTLPSVGEKTIIQLCQKSEQQKRVGEIIKKGSNEPSQLGQLKRNQIDYCPKQKYSNYQAIRVLCLKKPTCKKLIDEFDTCLTPEPNFRIAQREARNRKELFQRLF